MPIDRHQSQIFFENVVMNAVESAPSANKSRSKFGRRNAIRNGVEIFSGPKQTGKHHFPDQTKGRD